MKFTNMPDVATAIRLLGKIEKKKPIFGPRIVEKSLSLYGAGNLGKMAREYFDRLGISVQCVVDIHADQYKDNEYWRGIPVFFPDEVSIHQREHNVLAVCVATIPYVPLAEFLSQNRWKNVIHFYDIAEAYRDRHPLSNGWFANSLTSNDLENISTVLAGWADDISRAHHIQFIAWRLLREEWTFGNAPVIIGNRFFIPEILQILTSQESFADIGAHEGSVIINFLKETRGCFKKLWAIEPDRSNLKNLNMLISKLDYETQRKIQIIEAVVGCKLEAHKFYEGLGYASQISDLGQRVVEVSTLDHLEISPTFVKLHLEGAELDALMGAENIIHRYRPIIAATTYHNRRGLWEMPKWCMENLDGYRFLMRLHSWCGTGSMIYCIPEKSY